MTSKIERAAAKALAEKIATYLFTIYGSGKQCDRLVKIIDTPPLGYGGYCYDAIVNVVTAHLLGDELQKGQPTMTDSEPTTFPGCKLIGWVGRDKDGPFIYGRLPDVASHRSDVFVTYELIDAGSWLEQLDVGLMHAVPLFAGKAVDLTPVPAVEWLTVGENSIAACEGYSLCVQKLSDEFITEVRMNGVHVDSTSIALLPAAQSWAVSKARELARTAKGEM
jgi:hypothetical protein